MPSATSFDGEIALVTGALNGLGRDFATPLAAGGYMTGSVVTVDGGMSLSAL